MPLLAGGRAECCMGLEEGRDDEAGRERGRVCEEGREPEFVDDDEVEDVEPEPREGEDTGE